MIVFNVTQCLIGGYNFKKIIINVSKFCTNFIEALKDTPSCMPKGLKLRIGNKTKSRT